MTKDDYQSYLDAKKGVALAEELMEQKAKTIIKLLRNHQATRLYYGETRVLYSCGQPGLNTLEPDGDFPVELLWDPNWKDRVAFLHLEYERRHNEWMEKCQAKHKAELRDRELAELQRLKEKYKDENYVGTPKNTEDRA
jgi:hypothetical protein